MYLYLVLSGLIAISLYLWKINRVLKSCHPDVTRLTPKRWTEAELKEEYDKAMRSKDQPTANLPPKLGRRYIVVGGGGFVGGWIVHQLLERGEAPTAIRIFDLKPPTRPDLQLALSTGLNFIPVDIVDPASVNAAFSNLWSPEVRDLPLTVFHTAALIGFADRALDFMLPYYRVNVTGTENVLNAAKTAGASVFIATSSGSVGMRAPKFLMRPWQSWPKYHFQLLEDATLPPHQGSDDYAMIYAVSKQEAERIVLAANNVKGEFLTGAIRPGHAIIGPGTKNSSSLTYDFLKRGGIPSCWHKMVQSFASATNVALAHLDYEAALLSPTAAPSIRGRAFYITDPSAPLLLGDFYGALTCLSEKPVNFTAFQPIPLYLLTHVFEAYQLLQARYFNFLPKMTGDLRNMQPALFNMCSTSVMVSNAQAGKTPEEGGIGYRPWMTTMETIARAVLEWNESVADEK